MSNLDFAAMEQEIRKDPIRSYAPRRAVTIQEILPTPAPFEEGALTKEIEDNALRMSRAVGNVLERERQAQVENSDLRARLEQSDIRITAILSELESMRLKYESEHAERVRLRATFENVGGLVADALHFKHG